MPHAQKHISGAISDVDVAVQKVTIISVVVRHFKSYTIHFFSPTWYLWLCFHFAFTLLKQRFLHCCPTLTQRSVLKSGPILQMLLVIVFHFINTACEQNGGRIELIVPNSQKHISGAISNDSWVFISIQLGFFNYFYFLQHVCRACTLLQQ